VVATTTLINVPLGLIVLDVFALSRLPRPLRPSAGLNPTRQQPRPTRAWPTSCASSPGSARRRSTWLDVWHRLADCSGHQVRLECRQRKVVPLTPRPRGDDVRVLTLRKAGRTLLTANSRGPWCRADETCG
jgi:hypothetical protein